MSTIFKKGGEKTVMGNLGKYSIQPSPAQATAKGFSFKLFSFLEKDFFFLNYVN